MKFHQSFVFLIALAGAFSAAAQEPVVETFSIAGGGGAENKSVYSSVLGTLAEKCNTDVFQILETNTNGGVKNLELIKGNQVKAGIVPGDVLAVAKLQNASAVASISTLFTLHQEAAHLIVRAGIKQEGGVNLGKLGQWGGDKVQFDTPEALKGRNIGAVGGSMVTGQVLSDLLKYGWVMKSYGSTKELLAGLAKGEVDAILISAGLNSDAVKAIDGTKFKLLSLRGNAETSNVYAATTIQYENLNGNKPVDSLSARAYLVARKFSSPETLQNLAKLRACFFRVLPGIQDSTGVHPAWLDMNADEKGNWRWYDLPAVAGAPTSAKPAPAKKKV